MTVTMTSEAAGKLPGQTYTGDLEPWLLAEGYAKQTGYDTDTAAVLTGGSNAANIGTGGNLVISVGSKSFTVALAASDTPAAAATKIDTALSTYADAAITSSKLVVTSNKTGSGVVVRVKSGTGTVLANLGLTAGQSATGGDGGVGVSNTGKTSVQPSNDPTLASNREPLPEYDPKTGLRDSGNVDPAMTFTTADDNPNDPLVDPAFDFDAGGVNNDVPTVTSLDKTTGAPAGGTVVKIKGQNFKGSTGVTFGGTAGTSFSVKDDENITVTTPAHAAGAVNVVVTNATGTGTKTNAFTYA